MRRFHVVLIAVLAAGATITAGMFGFRQLSPKAPEVEVPPETLAEASPISYQEIESLNERLSTIQVVSKGLVVRGEAPSLRLSFEPTHPNYFFEGERYIIDAAAGSIHDIPTSDICNLIKAVEQERKAKVLEALDKVEMNGEFGTGGISFGGSATGRSAFETLYSLWKLTKEPGQIQVLLKGYADGEAYQWHRKQLDDYRFRSLPVLMPVPEQRVSFNPTVYQKPAQALVLPEVYGNKELPDLRSAFFKKDFIEPVLEGCHNGRDIKVFILKGVDIRGRDEFKRRVDVQIDFDFSSEEGEG